jgi:DNA-binding SARP family transcriptional activator
VGRSRPRGHGRAADVLGALFAAALAFSIVPAVLLFVVGNPLAGGLGHAWRPASRDALCVVVVAAWVAWAACCIQLLRAVAAHVRRGGMAPIAARSPLDRLAARIALGVLAVSGFGAPLALTPAAGAANPTRVHVGSPTGHLRTRPGAPMAAPFTTSVHVVHPGETLWRIAERRLQDGADWTAIAALNLGHDMSVDTRFVDPDQLRAGWRLRLPDASGPRSHGGRAAPRDTRPADGLGNHLPELLALGLGSLTCAALARRTRRHRECDRFTDPLDLGRRPTDAAVDTATLVNRFAEVPALASFEAANLLLGRMLHDRAGPPRVRAVCVGPEGVTFWLAGTDRDAPDGFSLHDDGSAWRVSHARLGAVEPFSPFVPIALPVGDDDEGTWLIVPQPGSVVPILGESADDLCRAARVAQESWSWADDVVVTDDPSQAVRAIPADDSVARGGGARAALYFGDPSALSAGPGARTAVVTTAMAPASDLTVLVDRHGASIHPLGRVVRPQLLDADRERLLHELTTTRVLDAADGAPGGNERARAVTAAAKTPGRGALEPGSVDVRLLTPTPRLDGLREEMPPNRARRAIELVAYLALHHPDVITSDRLRTRVLGSSDADAASKTLFNTAHAARRAMGTDDDGEALFPAGTRNGLYQLAPSVTVDVHRAAAFVAEGRACTDGPLAMAHFRAALELVEGEPLANALSGYSWWEAEGHGGRVAAVLVEAACSLAGLATAAGLFPLAWIGLERARVVAPYSEALSRAAMEVAAAEGDADRLRHEWRECLRRVDLLDPGSSPSARTESLYGELARRVLVTTAGDGAGPLR